MTLRVFCLAVLLALAGCSGAPVESDESTPTVTPAPVPDAIGATGDDAAVVGGAERGRAHARTLSLPHTRIHDLQVSRDGSVLLEYRETATVGPGEQARIRRTYSGPLTARFVPYVENASTAEEERYTDSETVSRRQSVDGIERNTRTEGPVALVAPLLITDDGALVAALLDDGRVAERTQSRGARLTNDWAPPRAVPQFLDDPQNVTVSATVREDGRVTRAVLSYEATLDGTPVVVEQTFRWTGPTEPVEPEWADE